MRAANSSVADHDAEQGEEALELLDAYLREGQLNGLEKGQEYVGWGTAG